MLECHNYCSICGSIFHFSDRCPHIFVGYFFADYTMLPGMKLETINMRKLRNQPLNPINRLPNSKVCFLEED